MANDILMKIFFTYAWRMRKIQCECGCGRFLPREFTTACMDHVLEKSDSQYPECKYSLSNIRYYTPDCHSSKTNGFPNEQQKEHLKDALENYYYIVEESSKFVDRVMKKIGGK